jgi:hypothetical protein
MHVPGGWISVAGADDDEGITEATEHVAEPGHGARLRIQQVLNLVPGGARFGFRTVART